MTQTQSAAASMPETSAAEAILAAARPSPEPRRITMHCWSSSARRLLSCLAQLRKARTNLREQHMAATLDEVMAHLNSQSGRTKIAVWAPETTVEVPLTYPLEV